MFEEIHIKQLGVIDSSTLSLGGGLTAITGETGAGKTMLVTALGLLLGGRADSGAVRAGAQTARVEGVVGIATLPDFAKAVEEAGGEIEDGRVVLARNVTVAGRSRAWVGGAGVPVSALTSLAQPLVAVHGQSEQHRLLAPMAQREALDRFAGEAGVVLLSRYAQLHGRLVQVERDLDDVLASARERAREVDQVRHALAEIEGIDPQPGEDRALATEETQLGYADTLRSAAIEAHEALSSEAGLADAQSTTAGARAALDRVRDHDPRAAELADRLTEIGYLLSDLATDVASYAAGLDTDPARLAAVSERRAALTGLLRKYGSSIDEVLNWAREQSARLDELQRADDSVSQLRSERTRLRGDLDQVAYELSQARHAAATQLSATVTEELTHLAMPHAKIEVAVTSHPVPVPDDPGPHVLQVDGQWLRAGSAGVDDVEILLRANPGAQPRPLHKGASGGELSRVMLALEVALAETSPVPTFVFDEVDAGIGGRAAIEVGARLARLARMAQVVVVTHLPQVAAYADRHVVVHKADDGTVTTSGLTVLDDEAREHELSRMLAGLEGSKTARAHARELLATAAAARSGAT